MYFKLLKEVYYKERKKLEGMWIYNEESKLRVLKLKRDIIERIEGHLTISELSERGDILEEVKENLIKDGENAHRLKSRFEEIIDKELTDIDNEKVMQLRNAKYPAHDYADYLFQLEKVLAIEGELIERGCILEEAYNEQKLIFEKG